MPLSRPGVRQLTWAAMTTALSGRSSAQSARGNGAVAAAVAGVVGPGTGVAGVGGPGAGVAGGWLGAGVTEPDGLAGREGPGDGVVVGD
jgi:hypothetical protein